MKDIFERLQSGEIVPLTDPDFSKVDEIVTRTLALSPMLNSSTNVDQIRARLGEIIGSELDQYMCYSMT